MSDKITLTFQVTFRHVAGPEQENDWLMDYFAGGLGEQNGAKPPMTLDFPEGSKYVVELVDA